jgi:hypothetical protein
LRRVHKIWKRLGGSTNMLEPFLERPKGMHRSTYMKLLWEYEEAHREQLAGMQKWVDKLNGR